MFVIIRGTSSDLVVDREHSSFHVEMKSFLLRKKIEQNVSSRAPPIHWQFNDGGGPWFHHRSVLS